MHGYERKDFEKRQVLRLEWKLANAPVKNCFLITTDVVDE